jgi:predicted amidophosphoribosyltransferase
MDMNATTNPSKPNSKGKGITTRPSTTLSIEHTAINNDVPTAAQQSAPSIKPIPSRVDYNFFNYCSQCGLKLPKNILRCISCKQKVRTKPWHRSKILQFKRI